MSDREKLIRQLEDQIGDIVDRHARELGAEEWRDIFDTVFAGMFGDGSEDEAEE